ncbi:hypothetical protein AAGG74_18410 [Bacillus mexicanus]|uniref:hypothetical protein n=1 Tax=Bacillus mexicanus TaxID=2834415 RepID=UPI003D25ABC8
MKQIIDSLKKLSNSYKLLAENANHIFNTLKIRDYKRKEVLENEAQELYKLKEKYEAEFITLIVKKADEMDLAEKKLQKILDVHKNEVEVLEAQYEIERLFEYTQSFQINLKRNIEFAKAFVQVNEKAEEIMFEAIRRERYKQGGSLLLNEEL